MQTQNETLARELMTIPLTSAVTFLGASQTAIDSRPSNGATGTKLHTSKQVRAVGGYNGQTADPGAAPER